MTIIIMRVKNTNKGENKYKNWNLKKTISNLTKCG